MEYRKILFLGGSGFLGSYLTAALIKEKNNKIFSISRSYNTTESNYNDSIVYINGDWRNIGDIERILKEFKIDDIIHFAWTSTPASSQLYKQQDIIENILPTINILELAVKYHVKRFVFASSGGAVYGQSDKTVSENSPTIPISFYGIHKLLAEKYILSYSHNFGLKYIICRIANPYGLRQTFMKGHGIILTLLNRIIEDTPVTIWGDPETVKDYIYIDDSTECILQILKNGKNNEIYNVGSGHGTSFNELFSIVSEVTGKTPLLKYESPRKWDVKYNVLSIDKVLKDTKWDVRTPIRTGIEVVWDQVKNSL